MIINPKLNDSVEELFGENPEGIVIQKAKHGEVYAALGMPEIVVAIGTGIISGVVSTQLSQLLDKFWKNKFHKNTSKGVEESVGCMKIYKDIDDRNRFDIEVYSNEPKLPEAFVREVTRFMEQYQHRLVSEKEVYGCIRSMSTNFDIKYDYVLKINDDSIVALTKESAFNYDFQKGLKNISV